jgi:O-antigen/teichoic acid export membrane protein
VRRPGGRPSDDGKKLADRLHRSIFFAGVERYGAAVLFLLSTAVLSRLLTPAEYGVYAAVLALTALGTASSQEFGGANYLIQKTTLSEQDVRTAFTITFCLSAVLGIGLFTLRGVAASFYAEPGLRTGILVFASSFVLVPFSATLSALLRRDMAFDVLARCNLTAAFVEAAVSIALTASGWSFLGPLTGVVMGQAVLVMTLIGYRRNLRIFRPSLEGWRDVAGFGVYSSATVIVNTIHDTAPQLILGRMLGFAAVGLYGRAGGVTRWFDRLFLGVLNPVIMPAIAAQTRSGADLKRLYLRAVELLTAAQWPFLTFVALMAEPIVRIWFGSGWLTIVPLVRLLSLASLALFAASLTYPVLVVLGRVRDTLTTSLISLPPSLLAIFVAAFFGVEAVAATALLTLPFQAAVAIWFIGRRLSFGFIDLFRAVLKSGIVTACSCTGAMVCIAVNNGSLTLPSLAFCAALIAGLLGWGLGLVITRHPLLADLRTAARDVAAVLSRAEIRPSARNPVCSKAAQILSR